MHVVRIPLVVAVQGRRVRAERKEPAIPYTVPMVTELPATFQDAVRNFKRFLAVEGFSAVIVWVFREDVAMLRGDLLLGVPIPRSNAEYARKLFYTGLRHGLGLRLSCLAVIDNASACYVEVPKDRTDAEYRMLSGGFQCSCPIPRRPARLTQRGLFWSIRRRRSDRWLTFLPSRSGLDGPRIPPEWLPPTRRKRFFVVDGNFTIRGRGTVFLPGIPLGKGDPLTAEEMFFKLGDQVELRRPDGTTLTTRISGTHEATFIGQGDCPTRGRYLLPTFADPLGPGGVPEGTEVWGL